MNVGSLFSGIGGLDLGLERAGMTVVWQSEIDPYASRVLAKHWPTVPNLGDVTTTDWSTVEPVDLICGGYPCQPFSFAGVRRGELDPRHLWPWMFDAIRDLGPRYVLIENVAGHLRLGFDRVLADLAELGFDADWSLVSACSMGASHVRSRLFCLAYAAGAGSPRGDARAEGLAGSARGMEPERLGGGEKWSLRAVEPLVPRSAHGLRGRVDRVRCLGNAVVPQVAEWIGRQIMAVAA